MSRRIQKWPQVYQKEFVQMLAEAAMIPEYEAEELVEIFLKILVTSLLQNRSVCFPAPPLNQENPHVSSRCPV